MQWLGKTKAWISQLAFFCFDHEEADTYSLLTSGELEIKAILSLV